MNDQVVEAAKEGQVERLRLALRLGGDVNAWDPRGTQFTGLHWAAIKGQEAVMPYLLDAGAQVDVRGLVGATALQLAVIHGNPGVAEALLRAGANKHVKNDKEVLPLPLPPPRRNSSGPLCCTSWEAATAIRRYGLALTANASCLMSHVSQLLVSCLMSHVWCLDMLQDTTHET